MKIEKTICDICGVECNGFAHVILNKADGEVIGINDFCPRCYSKIMQNVMKERDDHEIFGKIPYMDLRPQKWIPVEESLPKESGYYLVTTDGSHNDVIDIAEYGLDWRGDDFVMMWNKASKILAWMPLPEPYEVKSNE